MYGGCLTAMAVLSTGVGRLAGIGGAVFLVSDGLIALGEFVPSFDLPHHDFWVMLTYVLAQALIAVAVVERNARQRRAPEPAPRPVVSRPSVPDNVVSMVRAARRPQPTACTGALSGVPDMSRRGSSAGSSIG